MEDLNQKRPKSISIETAIKYAQASVYALQHSGSEITSKSIAEEMKMHYDRYDEKMVSILVKAYVKEKK